jgi:hypothetical protein
VDKPMLRLHSEFLTVFKLGEVSRVLVQSIPRAKVWSSLVTPEAYKEKNSKFLQIPSNKFLQMKSFERFSAMKFL